MLAVILAPLPPPQAVQQPETLATKHLRAVPVVVVVGPAAGDAIHPSDRLGTTAVFRPVIEFITDGIPQAKLQSRYDFHRYYGPIRLLPGPRRPSPFGRGCAGRWVRPHPKSSLHLFPPTFRTSRARRPRRAVDWTHRHFGLSDYSSGLPVSNPVSLHPSCRGSAARMFPVIGAHWMSFTFVTGCPFH